MDKEKIIKFIKTNFNEILVTISIIFMLVGYLLNEYNISYLGLLLAFSSNIIISIKKIKERFIFLIYNFMIFLFLLGRPLIGILNQETWWLHGATSEGVFFALFTVFFLLVSTQLGIRIKELLEKNKIKKENISIKTNYKVIQKVAIIIFLIAFIAVLSDGLDKIIFMLDHTYVDYYSSYVNMQPAIIKGLIRIFIPALFIMLGTKPSKKVTIFILSLYVLSTVPSLVVGMRSPIMLSILTSIIYIIIRNYTDKNEKWVNKRQIAVGIAILPILVTFLFSYNYIRNGEKVNIKSPIEPLTGFIYQQGNTFDVIARSANVLDELPKVGFPGYFFGPIYDRNSQGLFFRTLFNTPDVHGQTQEYLEISHDLKAHLSYLLMGDKYFEGHGVGTSIVLDSYICWGWIGIIIIGSIVGYYTVFITTCLQKNWITSSLVLSSIPALLYSPRSNAVDIIDNVCSIYFWFTISTILIIKHVIEKGVKNEKSINNNS